MVKPNDLPLFIQGVMNHSMHFRIGLNPEQAYSFLENFGSYNEFKGKDVIAMIQEILPILKNCSPRLYVGREYSMCIYFEVHSKNGLSSEQVEQINNIAKQARADEFSCETTHHEPLMCVQQIRIWWD